MKLRFGAELRTRWRAWLGLAVIVGLAGGAVITFAAGARRTDTAYPRFERWTRSADLTVETASGDEKQRSAFAHLPQVLEWSLVVSDFVTFGSGNGTPVRAALTGGDGTTFSRTKLLEGRRADPARPAEVTVGFDVARAHHLQVGSTFPLFDIRPGTAAFRGLAPEDQETVRVLLAAAPNGRYRVVGIVAAPLEFPPQSSGVPCCIHQSREIARLNPAGELSIAVRLRNGEADVDSYLAALAKHNGGKLPVVNLARDQATGVQRSVHVQAEALWILAGLTAIATALLLTQLFARLAGSDSPTNATLDALGMSRRARFTVAMLRVIVIGIAGAGIAVVVAVLASPIFPTGLARVAEPHVGIAFDPRALLLGAFSIMLAVPFLATLPAWLATRSPMLDDVGSTARRPIRHPVLVSSPIGLPAAIGARFATARRRAGSSVPTGISLVGVVISVVAVTAALTFGASLHHLLDSPRLSGRTWDLAVTGYSDGSDGSPSLPAALRESVSKSHDITASARLVGGIPARVDGTTVDLLALAPLTGDVSPPVVEGRAPRVRGEIALGGNTIRRLGAEIGDSLTVGVAGRGSLRLQLVGRVVLPFVSERAQLGTGGVITIADAADLIGKRASSFPNLALRLRPGADASIVLARLDKAYCAEAPPEAGCRLYRLQNDAPTDLVNFGRVDNLPVLLALVLAIMGAGTLAYMVVTTVRQQEHEFVILKMLGFSRGQVTGAVAAEASAVMGIALLIGIPVGVGLGRWLWSVRASGLGTVVEPRVSMGELFVVALVGVVVANSVALYPAWRAARLDPAASLRVE